MKNVETDMKHLVNFQRYLIRSIKNTKEEAREYYTSREYYENPSILFKPKDTIYKRLRKHEQICNIQVPNMTYYYLFTNLVALEHTRMILERLFKSPLEVYGVEYPNDLKKELSKVLLILEKGGKTEDAEKLLNTIDGLDKFHLKIYEKQFKKFKVSEEQFIKDLHKRLVDIYGKCKQNLNDYTEKINTQLEILKDKLILNDYNFDI